MKRYVRSLEPIECMATIGKSVDDNFCVTVNPDQKRSGVCYLKYFNSSSYTSADKVIRVSLLEPRVIFHKNRDGKKTWRINSKDKKNLVEFLKRNSKDWVGTDNWHSVLYHWNNELGLIDDVVPEEFNSAIEAFVAGYFDTKENLSHPSYVPSYLEMPDYTLIPEVK